jgi:uncharacterized repeat protein (TIGR03833 family)
MATPARAAIRPGMKVAVVEKQNQPTGTLTVGIVSRILTKSPTHPHGIKVMLADGTVGRVQSILAAEEQKGPLVALPPKDDYELE